MKTSWEVAILKCINTLGGKASLTEIYQKIGEFILLNEYHLRKTIWGGRPAYQHQIRSHLSNLCDSGDIYRISRGFYSITAKGHNRITQ